MHSIHIGGEEAEYLSLSITNRLIPGSTDYWDGNWLKCDVEVAVGAFRGAFGGTLRIEELGSFLPQLERLYECLSGRAELETLEGWIVMSVVGDGRGHLEAKCSLRDDPNYGSTLDFRLYFDQTYLPNFIRQIKAVLQDYPIVGREPH